MDRINILIIEDDPFLVEVYKSKLEQNNFVVDTACDGQEGLEKVNKNPDVILLDVIIPKIDGFEVLKRIRDNSDLKDAIVILLTNLGQKSDMEKGKSMGANDYIVKAHFTPTSIVAKIKEILNKRKDKING
ncbi:response regulator transcription factor [Patescibacteria group bacterium]